MPFYKCSHGADPQKCVEPLCRNWNGLQKNDVRSIFGQQSNSALANKLATENYSEYRRLKAIAEAENLIPKSQPIRCLQNDPEE